MKRTAIVTMITMLLLASLLLVGCTTTKYVPIEQKSQDIEYVEHHTTEFVHDTTYMELKEYIYNDTIYKQVYHYTEHIKLEAVHDTINIVKIDSIPYPVEIIREKEVKYTPWYIRLLSYLGLIPLCYLGFKGVNFIRRFV